MINNYLFIDLKYYKDYVYQRCQEIPNNFKISNIVLNYAIYL